jgi:hypothetical protein
MCSNPYFVTSVPMNNDEYLNSSSVERRSMLDKLEWEDLTIQQVGLIIFNCEGQLRIKNIMMSSNEDEIQSVYWAAKNTWAASEKGAFSRVTLYSTPIPPVNVDRWNRFVEKHYSPVHEY